MTRDIPRLGALAASSIAVILGGQSEHGAYVASPRYPTYAYAWLRDGSYCAMAMDAVGERASAERFHRWVAKVVGDQTERISHLVDRLRAGDPVDQLPMLPTRYTLDGQIEDELDEAWPNFQLDGYGTWLFALERHYPDGLPAELRPPVEAISRYLEAGWDSPCYDYWEEFGDRTHTSTFASIAAGLGAAGRMLGDPAAAEVSQLVLDTILRDCVRDGAFVKGPDDPRVDASLLSLSTPFELVPASDDRMTATLIRMATDLRSPTGGIRRYTGDTFYGGNPWLMLTAWFGWHKARVGKRDAAQRAREWVEAHATGEGWLAEQILDEPQDPAAVEPWLAKWGPVACPLLWSHASYLMLVEQLSAVPSLIQEGSS